MKGRRPDTVAGAVDEFERAARALFNEMRVALGGAPIIRRILASSRPGAWGVFAGCLYAIVAGTALTLTSDPQAGAIIIWVGVVGAGISWLEARDKW